MCHGSLGYLEMPATFVNGMLPRPVACPVANVLPCTCRRISQISLAVIPRLTEPSCLPVIEAAVVVQPPRAFCQRDSALALAQVVRVYAAVRAEEVVLERRQERAACIRARHMPNRAGPMDASGLGATGSRVAADEFSFISEDSSPRWPKFLMSS